MTVPGFVYKLARAITLYGTIHEATGTFIEEKLRYEVTLRREGADQWDYLTWNPLGAPDPTTGVIAGELVHDVRSALDHLVYALVTANNKDPGEHTQFPIYDSRTLWMRDIEERDPLRKPSPVVGLRCDQLAIIKKAQPYQLTANKKRISHPLMKLLRMSNVDKHQSLHSSVIYARPPTLVSYEPAGYLKATKREWARPGSECKAGAKIGRVKRRTIRRAPPGTQMQMRVGGAAEMVFSEPGKPRIASVDDLGEMILAARSVIADLCPGLGLPELPKVSPNRPDGGPHTLASC